MNETIFSIAVISFASLAVLCTVFFLACMIIDDMRMGDGRK